MLYQAQIRSDVRPLTFRVDGLPEFTLMELPGGSTEIEGVRFEVVPFAMGVYPVTQGLWRAVMGSNPSRFSGDERPVESVDWYDAVEFCNALSLRCGLLPAYSINKEQKDPYNLNKDDGKKWTVRRLEGRGFRLPTEAQWQYAAQAGESHSYSGGENLDVLGWYKENSPGMSQPVGLRQPNGFGLYDLSGNIWEWCWDWYSDPPAPAPEKGSYRVVRGGSWLNYPNDSALALRNYFDLLRYYHYGLRVCVVGVK